MSPKPKTHREAEDADHARRHRGQVRRAARRGRRPHRGGEGARRSRSRSAPSVLTVVAAYWFGKRKGKKRQMVLEIRRI